MISKTFACSFLSSIQILKTLIQNCNLVKTTSVHQHSSVLAIFCYIFFSNEMVLRVNLGPLHLIGNLFDDIFASNNAKLYVKTEKWLKQLPSKDINKTSTKYRHI